MNVTHYLLTKMILDSRAEYEKGVLSLLDRDSYASLLDLGCSYGGFTKAILERVKPRTACAIDMQPDKAMLSRRLGIDMILTDLNAHLPFEDGSFDVVVASQVIEHMNDTDNLAREIRRVIKPNGYAVISTPNLASWHNILYLILGKQPETATVSDEMCAEKEQPGHRRIFTTRELAMFLHFHGFKVEKVLGASYHPLPMSLARMACCLDMAHAGIITMRVRKCHI